MNDKSRRFQLGVFAMLSLGLLAALILIFGSYPKMLFQRQNEYTIYFSYAPGIDKGTPVRRAGIRIGEVKSVALDDEKRKVRVVVTIDRKYTLRRDEKPTIIYSVFGGDAGIDFLPDPKATEEENVAFAPGDEMEGERQANVNTLLADVVPTTRETLDRMRQSMEKIEKILPTTEETMKEFTRTAKDTRVLIAEVRETNKQVQEIGKGVQETSKEVQTLTRELRDSNKEVQGLAKDARETNKEVQGFVKDARETNKEVQGLTKDVRTMVPEINKTNTAVQELVLETKKTVPELRRTNEEIQTAARNTGKLAERVDVLIQANQDKILKMIEQFQETLRGVNSLFNEENMKNLSAMLKNVRTGTEQFEKVARNTDEIIKDSQRLIKNIDESVTKAGTVMKNVETATKPLAERSASVMKNLDESTEKLNKTLGDFREMLRMVQEGDGTLRRFLTDPALYNHLDELVCSVVKVLPRLQVIIKDVEVFADKLARHPELIGVGGVVRPSAGIKDPPTGFPTGIQRVP